MADQHTPPTRFGELLSRAFAPLRDLLEEPLPKGVNYFHVTGSLCLFLVALQIVTGILMAFYYAPSPDLAYESVVYVDQKVTLDAFGRTFRIGALIHGLHHWGSTAFVLLVFVHMIRVFTFGAYKGLRKWTWLVGVLLLVVVLGFGFTGYLLPWDMKAYFGTKVGADIVGYQPVIGAYASRFLLGGEEISELTLPRFYALHVLVLPAALLALIAAHLFLIRQFGITPPWKRDEDAVEYPSRFFPGQALRDTSASLAVFGILLFVAGYFGAELGDKADPLRQDFAPHPEWYFLGAQQLLRYFDGDLILVGTVFIPAGFFLCLILLPFLDRNPERRLGKRPVVLTLGGVVIALIVGLTVQGYFQLQEEREVLAQTTQPSESIEVGEGELLPAGEPVADSMEFDDRLLNLGALLYQRLECADCHLGPKVGKEDNVPPSLTYVGDRFEPRWIIDYLKEVPRRRWINGRRPIERMPNYNLSDDEARALTAHLMTMKKEGLFEGMEFDPNGSSPEAIERGKELYENESCRNCHPLGGQGDKKGPELDGVGSRLNPRFVFHIIKQPQSLIPDGTMEDTFMDDSEIADLSYYIMSLK